MPGSARDRRVESAHRLAMLALQSDRYSADSEYRNAVDAVLSWSLPAWTAQCQAPNDELCHAALLASKQTKEKQP
jgi:hypothetical protein